MTLECLSSPRKFSKEPKILHKQASKNKNKPLQKKIVDKM